MIQIGSVALKHFIPSRDNVDVDYIATHNEYEEFCSKNEILYKLDSEYGTTVFVMRSKPIEFEITEKRESSRLLYDKFKGETRLPLNALYMTKMSHRFKKNTPHFLKTMNDIHLMREHGAKISDDLLDIYKIRQKETYNYAHPILAKNKVDFFENNQAGYVKQDYLVYDHDTIHEAIKLYDKPAYDFIKISNEDVLCSKKMFDLQPEAIKLATVYEESCVLALERVLIPSSFKGSPKKAFLMGLEKVCTSIASGWWRTWAWENYYDVIRLYDIHNNYVDKFNIAKENNLLKLWEPQ